MALVYGCDCVLSLQGNTILRVRDLTVDIEADEVDATSRISGGWKDRRPGMRSWNADFDIVRDTGDTAYATLFSAFTNRTALTALISEPAGGVNRSGTCYVGKCSRSEPLNDVVTISVSLFGAAALA